MRIQTSIVLIGGALLTASTLAAQDTSTTMSRTRTAVIYFEPTGTTCTNTVAMNDDVRKVKIKTRGYDAATMISPDSAKAIALCNVPGQVTSGEINGDSTRTVYAITMIPNKKRTHTKVLVDARTGQVLSVKQFGGARGFAGWVRESAEHKKNKAKSKAG